MTALPTPRLPAPWAIGIGCRRDVGVAEIQDLLAQAFKHLGWTAPPEGLMLCTLAGKATEPALVQAADRLKVPLAGLDPIALQTVTTLTPSAAPGYGLPPVAEAAALVACGAPGNPRAHLVLPRIQGPASTCAVACSEGILP
ncbi:cobalamin biosynthesis protein [Nitrospirillum pindoramense]|uniref:Cobalamin synthesis G-like protein n=1 Tax=Nitrospirillum amazonense TaxID=28077 RepID=A0A560H5V4_9PROT|nr:cobalamin biosynthesis protein [Nitrospirillum amazonense]TWB41189.1 cobalamin synthesis G-like protein [Nitrospirillum amazonense]